MLKKTAVAAVVVLTTMGGLASAQNDKFAPVKATLAKAIEARDVPGAVVVIRKNGKVVFSDAQGTFDKEPLKIDSVIWVASMTKPIVAATVMMMIDEGKVKLDDPVSRFVPEFAQPHQVRSLPPGVSLPAQAPRGTPTPALNWQYEPAKRTLTVRDIITMTAGLQTIGVPGAMPPVTATDTVATWVAKLGGAPLDFQPGSRWGYSNATEFEVAVRIVEVASGESYGSFVQRRVFDPLGMKDSAFGVREDLIPRLAAPNEGRTIYVADGKRFTSGSAGLWTTAEDYSKFGQMLLDDGKAPDGKRVLSVRSARAMHTNQIGDLSLAAVAGFGNPDVPSYGGMPATTNPAIKYGFGLMVIEDPAGAMVDVPKGSYGWDGVSVRRFWVMPRNKAVMVMLVPSSPRAAALHRALETAAAPLLK